MRLSTVREEMRERESGEMVVAITVAIISFDSVKHISASFVLKVFITMIVAKQSFRHAL